MKGKYSTDNFLFHLDKFDKFKDSVEVPLRMTQEGLANTFEMSRSRVSKIIKKLEVEGLLLNKLAHVRDRPRKVRAYYLSNTGVRKILKMKKKMDETFIDYADNIPEVERFFGRSDEISAFDDWFTSDYGKFFILTGIAGIGKTIFMSKVVQTHKDRTNIYKIRFSEWMSLSELLTRLGTFLSDLEKPGLQDYVRMKKDLDLNEVITILSEDLAYLNCLLIFDDYHKIIDNEDILHLFRVLKIVLEKNKGTKAMIIGREVDRTFYDERDVSIRNIVKEVRLEGLDREDSINLLMYRNIVGKTAERLYKATKGHPYALELMQETDDISTRVTQFFSYEIFNNLDAKERKVLEITSVFRYPVQTTVCLEIAYQCQKDQVSSDLPPSALGLGESEELIFDYSVIHSLMKKSLLQISGGICDVHDGIRDYLYESLNKSLKKTYHEKIAVYYLSKGTHLHSTLEAQHHLLVAEDYEQAIALIKKTSENLLNGGYWRELQTNIDSIPLESISAEDRPEILLLKGRLLIDRLELDGALEHLNNSIEEFDKFSNIVGAAKAHLLKSRIQLITSSWDEALKCSNKALMLYSINDNIKGMGEALHRVGTIHMMTSDYSEALRNFKKALLYSKKAKDQRGVALTHADIGFIMNQIGEKDKALTNFKKALTSFKLLKDKYEIIRMYNNIGATLSEKGMIEEASEWINKGLKMAEDISDLYLTWSKANLAELKIRSGRPSDLETALKLCDEIQPIAQRYDVKRLVGFIHHAKGNIYYQKGEPEASLENFKLGLEVYEKGKMPTDASMLLLDFGRMLAGYGMTEEAVEKFQKMLKLCKETGNDIYAKIAHNEIDKLKQ